MGHLIEPEGAPTEWPPLGLPTGSVRAMLTLFVVAVVTVNVARGQDIDLIWTETLLIAMAHYFTTRRFVTLPPEVLKRIQDEGVVEQEKHPLFLPQHSIRFLILAAFIGLGVYLYQEKRLFEARSISLLGIVFAYIAGTCVRTVGSWFRRSTGRKPSSMWGDAKALIVLAAVALAGLPELFGMPEILPAEAHRIALALMLFYFGSR